MIHEQQTDRVRQLVSRTFADLGLSAGELRETILIREGHYCGRRFEIAEASAVWFVEENEIKIYRAGSAVAQVPAASAGQESRRMAA